MSEQWMADAACRNSLRFAELPIDDQLAYCAECPVVKQCLEFAIASHAEPRYVAAVYGGRKPRSVARLIALRQGSMTRQQYVDAELAEAGSFDDGVTALRVLRECAS
jgi:hypothetical protein